LENRFPDLEKFIALGTQISNVIEIDRKELKEAIDWVSILSESFDYDDIECEEVLNEENI
jgi:DNA polymerase III sliding clamp (beta) subunit (PCNA family)